MWVIFCEPINILYKSSFMAAHFETENYTVLRRWQHINYGHIHLFDQFYKDRAYISSV